MRKCVNAACGLVWLDPRPIPEDIGKAYQTYFAKVEADPTHLQPSVTKSGNVTMITEMGHAALRSSVSVK